MSGSNGSDPAHEQTIEEALAKPDPPEPPPFPAEPSTEPRFEPLNGSSEDGALRDELLARKQRLTAEVDALDDLLRMLDREQGQD